MVQTATVADGRLSYRNRWVRTPNYDVQRRAGKRLFPLSFGAEPLPEANGVSPNPSNTNILWHGGRLLSLQEGSTNAPMAIDPDTLATVGPAKFGGYEGPLPVIRNRANC